MAKKKIQKQGYEKALFIQRVFAFLIDIILVTFVSSFVIFPFVDNEALEKLIEDNQGLLWSIVKRFTGRNYETEDLYQIGCMGFIKAIKRFDTSFEVQISTYAVPYILGEIKKFIRDDGIIKVSRSVKELGIKIKQLQSEYLKKNHEEINIAQISKELKVDKEEIIFVNIDIAELTATRHILLIN